MLWLLAWPHVAGDPDQWQSVRGINHREGPQKNTASHPPSGARDPQIMRCGLLNNGLRTVKCRKMPTPSRRFVVYDGKHVDDVNAVKSRRC